LPGSDPPDGADGLAELALCPGFLPLKSISGAAPFFFSVGIAGARSTGTKKDRRHSFAALALTLNEFEALQKKPRPKIGS
jgi:hypothetical protein